MEITFKIDIPDEKINELALQAISKQSFGDKRETIETATANKGYDDQITSMIGLAQFLKCSVVTAQELKNSGKIRCRQFGRKVIFLKSEVMEDLEKISFKKKKPLNH